MRIQKSDSVQNGIVKMGEGNPGAITVCINLLKFSEQISPNAGPGGGLTYILALDEFQIYGCRIWMLFKDVCGESLHKMVAVLVARSAEIISQRELELAIDGTGLKLDLDTLMDTITEKFPQLEV
jgi:hypothetical protein